nr:UBN2 domain-containing protein [Tanacetum cinerariifolium]
ESIDNDSARFDTIITSLKALDEGFSSKNYVRKFLRVLHPKWREKVTMIEELKDFSSLALDELIGNLKVHEVVMEKDSEIYRGQKERVKSIALKAKKESSNDETLTSKSDDEEYDMAVRNFKKFFKRKSKEIAKPVTPPSVSEFDENSDPEQAQKDKEMQKNLALNAKKPKLVKDYTYHKENMLMCKQAEKGVPLQAKQADWLEDIDEEVDEQELEAHYSYMAKIQEVLHADSDTTVEPLTEKANASLTHELEKYQINLEETTKALGETTSSRDSCLIALQNKQSELEKYIAFNDQTVDYDKL